MDIANKSRPAPRRFSKVGSREIYGLSAALWFSPRKREFNTFRIPPGFTSAAWILFAAFLGAVVPTFRGIFDSFEAELPLATTLLVFHPRSVWMPLSLSIGLSAAVKCRGGKNTQLNLVLLTMLVMTATLTVYAMFAPMKGL